jgi:hypothetical protein
MSAPVAAPAAAVSGVAHRSASWTARCATAAGGVTEPRPPSNPTPGAGSGACCGSRPASAPTAPNANGQADGLTGRLDLLVQAADVGQQVAGDALALGIDLADRADLAQQGSGPGGRQLAGSAARVQVGQQHVQAAQGAGALGDQVVAAVAAQPQDHGGSSAATPPCQPLVRQLPGRNR